MAVPEILAGSSLSEVVGNGDEEGKNMSIGGIYKTSYRCRRVASKTVLSFQAKDPENPINWSTVCILSVQFQAELTE